jgi:hypothetical protein
VRLSNIDHQRALKVRTRYGTVMLSDEFSEHAARRRRPPASRLVSRSPFALCDGISMFRSQRNIAGPLRIRDRFLKRRFLRRFLVRQGAFSSSRPARPYGGGRSAALAITRSGVILQSALCRSAIDPLPPSTVHRSVPDSNRR